jgi:hypothetical protein
LVAFLTHYAKCHPGDCRGTLLTLLSSPHNTNR